MHFSAAPRRLHCVRTKTVITSYSIHYTKLYEFIVCKRGARPERRDFPPARAVLANLEAFAEAARGGAPYPVPQEQMIANICALEAVVRSTRSGKVEAVEPAG